MSAAFGHLQPGQITPLMVGALVSHWRKKYAPETAYKFRAWLKRLLIALGNPLPVPKVPRPSPRAVTASPEELAKLFASPAAWLRLFMLLYFQCGLRRTETLRVTPRTWNQEQHTVTIQVKGGRIRTAEVTPEVEALFLACGTHVEKDVPFIHHLHGGPIRNDGLYAAWKRHRDRCGVNPKLTSHDLRRSAASILYAATKDLRVPQQLLGHKNLSSTLTYLAPLAPDEARRYAELLRFERFYQKEGDKPS